MISSQLKSQPPLQPSSFTKQRQWTSTSFCFTTLKAQEILKETLLNNLLGQSLLQVSAIRLKQQAKFLKPSISSFSFQLHFSRAQPAIREVFQPKRSQQLNTFERKRAEQVHSLSQSAQLQLQRNIIQNICSSDFSKYQLKGVAPPRGCTPSDQKS